MTTPNVSSSTNTPRHHTTKRTRRSCSMSHCTKMDAGGGLCVAHGGGKKCAYPNCLKGSQTGGFCRQHGGGARCTMDGCTKVDAGKGLCRAHGGGKRCQADGCKKADVGGGYCTAHGGGKRCSENGCNKVHQGNGRCRAHGGARRCQRDDCNQLARGNTGYCSAHGGALLCSVPNCRRMARVEKGTLCYICDRQQTRQNETIVKPIPRDPLPPVQYIRGTNSTSNSGNSSGANSPSCRELPLYGASCLDNGCSRAFGAECNCKDGCVCCASLKGSVPPPQRSTQHSPSPLVLHRILIHIDQTQCITPLSALRAMLSSLDKVLTAHELAATVPLPATFVLVCEPTMNWTLLKTVLDTIYGSIVSTSTINWSSKEVVLHVPEMMCPGNCGRTVVGAIEPVPLVTNVQLLFGPRYIVVRGDMIVDEVISAVQNVGFEANIIATTPLLKTHRFHVTNLSSVHLLWNTHLQSALERIEGVKTVLLDLDQNLVVIQGVVQDNEVLKQTALTSSGVIMVEDGIVPVDDNNSRLSPVPHECDTALCVTGKCPQYQAKVAHTAALAVGWVVPGCPMSWGGECTCGEKCKCVGCPQHNPTHPLL